MTGPSSDGGRWQWAGAEGAALVFRDDTGAQQFVSLEGQRSLTLGRGSGCDVRLAWDDRVSRVHAGLERVGPDWALVDDGLSRNGTFLNGERLNGRRRLRDGDTFVLGSTSFRFRDTTRGRTQLTTVGEQLVTAASLSPTQRQIVTALCRPYKHDDPYATPASNQLIADGAQTMQALASKSQQLTQLISNTSTATGAIARQSQALDEALTLLDVSHEVAVHDLLTGPDPKPADVTLLLKAVPCIETQQKELGWSLIDAINSPVVVVSFPTKSLGQRSKGMYRTYSSGFTAHAEGRPWQVEELEFGNELVYVVQK